ncbi:hypothetical protein KAOT1_07698 [Kordia algicida OT-1]|uniref:Uncharacterized protein n=1 Tax=Kordia algicida OT-1 TaxID=391587 RepID=A9DXR1_9FLAO|nr:hypothetical protein KAOT1_07698 [Kordia algicida OT-1]
MKFLNCIFILFLGFGVFSFAQNDAKSTFVTSDGVSSENYRSITFNGVWSWFSDPRAVYFEGKHRRTYAGWIDNYGDVHVGFYDHKTQKVASTVIYDNLEIDDHDNPSIIFDADGRLLVFFNTHLQDDRPLFMRTSTNPEDISDWSPMKELYLNDTEKYSDSEINRHTYTNPVRLSKENGKLYIFWRGIDLKPSYSVSTDNGKTWSKGEILFIPKEENELKAPYTKVYSDGNSKIHFTFTDGHPTKEKKNGLYYMYYENGAFYKANGQKIKEVSKLPILQEELDVIFESETIKSWNWDIAEDENGNPIVTYVKFPKNDQHVYSYAIFRNDVWQSFDLITVNGWFPETRAKTQEPEPHYAGGITIDHESPNTVYLSVKRDTIFEIEQWTTNDFGESWKVKSITKNSTKNNVRPVSVRGAEKGNPLQVLWLQNTKYIYYAHDTHGKTEAIDFKDRYHTAVKMNLLKPQVDATVTIKNCTKFLREIAESLLENPDDVMSKNEWYACLAYQGLNAFCDVTNETRYKNELRNMEQYQLDETEDLDEEVIDIYYMIWSHTTPKNRKYLQRIETVNSKDFENRGMILPIATWMYAIRNYKTHIAEIDTLRKDFPKVVNLLLNEIKDDSFLEVHPREASLITYILAAGINDNLIDTKHSETVLKIWQQLQENWLSRDFKLDWTESTKGAVLLAGKEVLEIINTKN